MISSSRKIRRVSDYLKFDKLIVWLWISCIFVTAVSSQDNFYASGRFGKRKDALSMSQLPLGSRFGRSEGRSSGNSLKESSLFSAARFGRSDGRSTGNSLKESSLFSPARFGRSEGRSTGNSLKESSLFSAARFGRSEGANNLKESPKLFEIEPRVDRFFLGSRYGKRSSSVLEPQRAPPEAMNYQRFEAAIDYLDRIKQDLAEAEEIEDETRNTSRDDELVEAVYPYAYTGLSKI